MFSVIDENHHVRVEFLKVCNSERHSTAPDPRFVLPLAKHCLYSFAGTGRMDVPMRQANIDVHSALR